MDVLANPGASKSWMVHPKEYTALTDIMSAYASGFWSSDILDKQLSSSPDWYSIFYPSTSNSHSDFHLLHHPSPTIDAQHPRKSATVMKNQHRLPGPPMPLMEDRGYTPLRVEDPRTTGYSQSVSPFTTRLDLNRTLSSNGSTYCESDLESLEHFDEPVGARTMETHAGLVHPTPRSNMFTVPSNSFLLGTEETSYHEFFAVSSVPRDEQSYSNTQFNVPNANIANYAIGTPFNPQPQNTHLAPSITPPDAKPVNYNEDIQWPVCPSNTTDVWYPTRDPNGSSDDSAWHAHNAYSAPWPVNNAYTCLTEYNRPATHVYGMSSGLPIPSFGHAPGPLGSSAPMAHQSYMPTYVPYVPPVEAPSQYHPTPQLTYPPNTQPISPNTEFGSPDQKPENSLSPSFSVSTNEEERFSQQSEEEQSGIETSLQYSDERNTFLIDCKRRGLSYKDIKRVGGFKEAESTLRGRYRTLTKSKEQRVRKPKWQDKDIRLLCEAVSIHAETHDAYHSLTNISMNMNEPPKVSWKKVAEHIWGNGGSYHFGNATCKKKWCEINNITI
ncbi:hypothetical protein N7491_009932 [Penicillium cf. griseofulvum]|uniref:Myb-like domain-containing protein n=1 Tax=Penicillium cf. griseofulvum TaxID=2972120 RepID=A0A9W9MYY4_9EURO|nr:hypothetical protein N7472_000260 [Penicillium cf. griseofulvum]KAJ5421487.1 hypothetical protein N7491_009932 [Penicillium cf. griseofulvum]KAJ5424720.1 hypothetical protein N7445_010693 [Penicillium cf. griseofulvum]